MPKKTSFNKALFLALLAAVMIASGWFLMNGRTHQNTPTELDPLSMVPQPDVSAPAPGEQTLMNAATSSATDAASSAEKPVITTKPIPQMAPEGRFLGKKEAPVQMIEFSSLTCVHCANFHNERLDEFRVKYVDTGLVRIEFREFPLNKPALDATLILNCLPKDRYFPFMSVLFQTQDHWAFSNDYLTSLKQNAKLAGMNDATFDACLSDTPSVEKLLTTVKAYSEKYKIESTPTFIINDGAAQIVGSRPLDEFADIIDPLLPQNKTK